MIKLKLIFQIFLYWITNHLADNEAYLFLSNDFVLDNFYKINRLNNIDQVISVDSPRGGVSIVFEKGDATNSILLVQNANVQDSGQYTCSSSNVAEVTIKVYVLSGIIFRIIV